MQYLPRRGLEQLGTVYRLGHYFFCNGHNDKYKFLLISFASANKQCGKIHSYQDRM